MWNLADFIRDDMIADDRNISEPTYPDFPVKPEKPKRNNYQKDVWNASNRGSGRNQDTGESGYWTSEPDDDAYNIAYEQYQAAYEVWKTETDNLKKEYTAALEVYQGKMTRDDLRAAFDDEKNAITNDTYDPYYWTPSEDSLVASDVVLNLYYFGLASSSEIPAVV